MIDRMFARLRPDELDELAEASYRRRRADDLARAFTGTQHPEKPTWRAVMFRRPLFLLATSGAVAAIAAGAIAVSTGVLSGTPTGENRVAVGSSSTGTARSSVISSPSCVPRRGGDGTGGLAGCSQVKHADASRLRRGRGPLLDLLSSILAQR